MLDQLEALHALHETGSTNRAAARLRITQSAVSKRLAALEDRVGVRLVEKSGRRLILTPAGSAALASLEPHLRALKLRLAALELASGLVRIAATESLLSASLPPLLRLAAGQTQLELHAHRGPLVLERVRAGAVDLGVCVFGEEDGLVSIPLGDEPMVLVPSADEPLLCPPPSPLSVWTIEPRSLIGAWLDRRLPRHPWPIVPQGRIESFASAVQLARAGFGPALVPRGIAAAMGVPTAQQVVVPGLSRPIGVVATPTALARPVVAAFVAELVRVWQDAA